MGSQEKEEVIEVGEGLVGLRLDIALTLMDRGWNRSTAKKMIDSGLVLVNQTAVKSGYRLRLGEKLAIYPKTKDIHPLAPIPMDLDILFEDEHLIVLNKPAGLSVHPGAGEKIPTLVHGLLAHCRALSPSLGEDRPGIVHRLDKETSGIMVCAKTEAAHRILAKQFAEKTNHRYYVALLDGVLPHPQWYSHESWVGRHVSERQKMASFPISTPSRPGLRIARSHFLTWSIFANRLSMVVVKLDTGRTHQIRVHALDMSCPVLGDPVYQRNRQWPSSIAASVRQSLGDISRQMLHAAYLGFIHPTTEQAMAFCAPPPLDFGQNLRVLEPMQNWTRDKAKPWELTDFQLLWSKGKAGHR